MERSFPEVPEVSSSERLPSWEELSALEALPYFNDREIEVRRGIVDELVLRVGYISSPQFIPQPV